VAMTSATAAIATTCTRRVFFKDLMGPAL